VGVSATFQMLAELLPEQRLALAEAALREPFLELQTAALSVLIDPAGLNRPDLVVQHYTDLLPEVRRRVAAQPQLFQAAVREEILSGSEWARRAGYEVVAAMDGFNAMATLARAFSDPSALVRECAADLLEGLAQRYYYHLVAFRMHGDPQSREFVERHRDAVIRSLGDLLRAYPAHGKRVFLDLAIESDPDSYPLVTDVVLARRDVPTFAAFVAALSSSPTRSAVELLFKLYLEPRTRLREVAVEVMRMRHDAAFASLVAATLARMPQDAFESLARRVREIPWWGAVEAAPDLDSISAAKMIEFVSKSGLEREARDAKILWFHSSPYPEVRARVLATLQALDYPSISDLAAGFLQDPSDDVKLAAARAIVALGSPNKTRLLLPFLTSTRPELREISAREVSGASFDRYLRSFDTLDPRTRELAAKALAKIDHRIVERLAEEITSLDADRRLKALRIIDYVEAQGNLRELLLELLRDPDRRIRATVLKIVELTGSLEGMKHLVEALNDPDARVRANAIEAFEDGGDPRTAPLLVPFLTDPDNRARANAAKALHVFGRPEGRQALEAMVEDPNEMMRLSGVWAVGEAGFDGAADLLLARGRREPSATVKSKISDSLLKLAQRSKTSEGAPRPAEA
jgi:HEAT repeat protein